MEKMSTTFYILTVLGALLVPIFAENATTINITTIHGSVSPKMNPVNVTSSINETHTPKAAKVSNTTTAPLEKDVPTSGADKPSANNEGNVTRSILTTTVGNTTARPDSDAKTNKDVPTPGPDTNTSVNNVSTITRSKPTTTVGTARPVADSDAPGPGTKPSSNKEGTTTRKPATTDNQGGMNISVYIIILIIVIFAVIGVIFFCAKSNKRRYSVDIHTKNEEAHIPLATVEPEMCDSSPKDMKTFAGESSPTVTVEKTEGDKAPTEDNKQVEESPAEIQTTVAPAEKPAELTDMDMNDGDPTASTKTSVETLNDVLNENNSNNNAVHDVKVCFIEISLNE